MAAAVDLLLRGARLVSPTTEFAADIALAAGRFAYVGAAGAFDGAARTTVDVTGLTALPGLVDPHTHFREPGEQAHKANYATESRAAAAGGVTTVLTMPNCKPPIDSAARLAQVKTCAERSIVHTGFHFMATADNLSE